MKCSIYRMPQPRQNSWLWWFGIKTHFGNHKKSWGKTHAEVPNAHNNREEFGSNWNPAKCDLNLPRTFLDNTSAKCDSSCTRCAIPPIWKISLPVFKTQYRIDDVPSQKIPCPDLLCQPMTSLKSGRIIRFCMIMWIDLNIIFKSAGGI